MFLLLACAVDPLPESAELARAGYRLHREPADEEERAGLDAAAGLEGVVCWRVERDGAPAGRVCSYDFEDEESAMAWSGGPRERPGSAVHGYVHGDRLIRVRAPDEASALAIRAALLAWDEPAWWEVLGRGPSAG